MRKKLAAALATGALVLGLGTVGALPAGAATVPAYHPSRLRNVGSSQQVVVVTGNGRTSSYATLRAFQKGSDGRWRQQFAGVRARTGYAGWAWAGRRVQGTGTTPMGTFRITSAFGLEADPGTRVTYTHAGSDDYWAGDDRDPKTYNLFQPRASRTRTWRKGRSERLAAYPVQYEYAAVIDFNRPAAATVRWDSAHGQYVTSRPANVRRGSAIFLHVNGAGSTAGCVSLRRADLLNVLRWLDPAGTPRIVMAPLADIGRV